MSTPTIGCSLKPTFSDSFEAVIVHYRDPEAVRQLLDTMLQWISPPSAVTIADNSGELVDFLSEHLSTLPFPVRILPMEQNVGYGPALNAAARHVTVPIMLVLTQDARLEDDASAHLISHLVEHPEVGVVAPLLAYASNPNRIFSAGGTLLKNGRTLHPAQGDPVSGFDRSAPPYDVRWVDGACFAVQVEIFREIGGFDPNFFLYVEEVDLHLRLRKAGYEIHLVPQALGFQEPGNYTLYYKYRNLTYFTRKHHGALTAWPWPIALPKDLLRMALKGKPGELPWAIRGLIDSRRGSMGVRPQSPWLRR